MSLEARIVRLEEAMADLAEAQARAEEVRARAIEEEKEFSRGIVLGLNKKWSELADKMGTLAEDIVAPGFPDLFRELFGVADLEMSALRVRRANRSTPGVSREFDYVALGGGILLVNETKSTLRMKDILRFLRILGEIREYFPEAATSQVVGSLAAITIDPSLVVAGERRGLLMLGLETGLQVLNTPGFKPRMY